MYRERIISVVDNMGLLIELGSEDINLQDYIIDSLQFISFIIELEKAFDIEFPNDLLLYDNIQSLNGLAILIEHLVENKMES